MIQEWDAFDRRMAAVARLRGQVLVLDRKGREVTAVLVCWRGRRNGRRARVQFREGVFASVDTADVRPLPEDSPCATRHA